MNKIWLKEPIKFDNTWAETGEHTLDWLQRATLPRAKQMRQFLNYNLSRLPDSIAEKLKIQLRSDWYSAFFELIVGRLLQETGFEMEYEKELVDGKRPDFVIQTHIGKIVVEATAPVINATVGEFYKQKNPLVEIIKEQVPKDWIALINGLPDIGPNDSKKYFKKLIQTEFKQLPRFYFHKELYVIDRRLPEGRIKLDMMYKPGRSNPIGMGPATGYAENSENRIQNAIHKKREQLKNIQYPVILAIRGSFTGTDYDDFDHALIGRTFEQYDMNRKVVKRGFNANGLLISENPNPTCQGILAIPFAGFREFSKPVLYLHKQANPELKSIFSCFGVKFYNELENRIEMIEPESQDYMECFQFVTV